MATVRKMRHWRQKFDVTARMRWRRPVVWAGIAYQAGDIVPSSVVPGRLRRLWAAKFIELADFVETDIRTGRPMVTTECSPDVVYCGGAWYSVTVDGSTQKVRGKSAVRSLLRQLQPQG